MREIEADGFITRDEDLKRGEIEMADCARRRPLTDKEKEIGRWGWTMALIEVANHIDNKGRIDKEFAKSIKRYAEARK